MAYRAGVAFGSYDNVNLVSEPTEQEFSQSLNAGVRVFEDSSSLYANFDANFSTFNYKNDIAADRNYGQLLANIIWRIKPGNFEWIFDNNFTQSVIDPLESNSPANRQNINVVSTGPNYIIRLNPRNNIQMEVRAENYSFEESEDNNRVASAVRWLHNVNTALMVSLNNENEIARFKSGPEDLDFNRNDLFLGINYSRGLNVIFAEYGVSSVKNENINDISSDRYFLSITNTRTQTSSIELDYENYLSNTGNQVRGLVPDDGGDAPPIDSVANDVFVNEQFRLQYNESINNGVIRFNASTGTRRYERFTDLDIDVDGLGINALWYMHRNSSFILDARYLQTDYVDPGSGRSDEDRIYSLEYRYRIKRNISVSILTSSLERISTIEDRSYEDVRIFLSFNYFSI